MRFKDEETCSLDVSQIYRRAFSRAAGAPTILKFAMIKDSGRSARTFPRASRRKILLKSSMNECFSTVVGFKLSVLYNRCIPVIPQPLCKSTSQFGSHPLIDVMAYRPAQSLPIPTPHVPAQPIKSALRNKLLRHNACTSKQSAAFLKSVGPKLRNNLRDFTYFA